jgi:hypothetical protein
MIVDFLHDDVTALCNAGLVCKSWLPASRFHLFSTISFAVYNVHRALAVICAEGSTIPPYILDLEIRDNRDSFADEALRRLPLLNNLRNLTLEQIKWGNLTPGANNSVITMSQNLATLSLFFINVCIFLGFPLSVFCLISFHGTV